MYNNNYSDNIRGINESKNRPVEENNAETCGEIGYETTNPFHHLMAIHLSNLLKNMP